MANGREKEMLVIKLHKAGNSYRDIARIARISVRDIKPILHKYGAENGPVYDDSSEDASPHLPNSTKAYKLFAEGKSPLQVSIALNLRAPEVKTLCGEYWQLRGMYSLGKLYNEIGDKGVLSLLQLHRSSKAQGIGNQQIIEYLAIYGNDLPLVKRQYEAADIRLQGLLNQEHQTERDLQELNVSIRASFEMFKSIQAQCAEAERERNTLAIQKLRLRRFISEHDGIYMEIERFVQEKVNKILRNNMKLLELSLISALKAIKNDPNVYRYLFHKLDQTAAKELIASMPNQNSHSHSS